MKRKVLEILLVCTLVITNFGSLFYFQTTEAAQVSEIKENYNISSINVDEVSDKPKLEDLSEDNKDVIDYATSIAEESGEEAAEALNQLDEDDAVVDYVSDSYEILIDNNFEIDTSLSQRK